MKRLRSVRIVSIGGSLSSVEVFDANSGNKLTGVKQVQIKYEAGQPVSATIEFLQPEIEITPSGQERPKGAEQAGS